MPKVTKLDKQWEELMFLCDQESAYRRQGDHPKLLTLVVAQIEELAASMGFSDSQIRGREFRAEREGGRIVRLALDPPAGG